MALLGFLKSTQTMDSGELRTIYDALDQSQAIIAFKPDGTIIDANRNFLEAMEYTLKEVQGRHHRIFVDPSYAESADYKAFWSSLRDGRFQQAEFKRFAKSGREVWIQATYMPVKDRTGSICKVVKFATDVTEKKLAEADATGQIKAIHEAQAVIEFEPDGTIRTANANFLSAVGYTLDEIQGKHHRIFVDPAEANSPEYRKLWTDLAAGKHHQGEYRRLTKDGGEIYIQATYNPIRDMDGRTFKVVKFASDITAQVQARQRNEEVARIVKQNADDIGSAVEAATEQVSRASSASTETTQAVQTAAAGAEELSSSVEEISRNMASSREQVRTASSQTHAADEAAQALSQTTASMGGIVGLIQDIAAQINLLALNATIESARAGEAGKGFAVVANEVKGLAGQVADATGKISTEIDSMQSVSSSVVDALGAIKSSIEAVETSTASVATAVEQQSSVTREIAENMMTTSNAVSNIDDSIQEIRESIDNADRASSAVRQAISQVG